MSRQRLYTRLSQRFWLITALLLLVLSIFTGWFFGSKPSVSYQQQLLQRYIIQQQKEAAILLNDTVLLKKLVTHTVRPSEFKEVTGKKFGLFLYRQTDDDSTELLFWNNQKIIPPNVEHALPDSVFFQHLLNGYYVTQKKTLPITFLGKNVIAYVLIPVLNKFYLETEDSQTRFAHDENAINKIAIATGVTNYPLYAVAGQSLFYIQPGIYYHVGTTDNFTIVLRLLSLLSMLIFLHLSSLGINNKKGAYTAFFYLAGILVVFRFLLWWFPALFSLRQFQLFDPTIYASNSVNRSLGDLLINAIILCWLVLFAWNSFGPIKKTPGFLKGRKILIAGVVAVFALIFVTFQLANVVHQLVSSSKISFDVTYFFKLNTYTVFGFLVLAILSLTYYFFARLLFRFILTTIPNLVHLYFAVAVTGLIYLSFQTGDSIVLFHLPVLLWLVLFTLLLSQEKLIINRFRITFAGILFWIFIFSGSLALLIMQGNREVELRERKRIADKFEQLTEPTKEKVLTIGLSYLDNRFLKNNFNRFYHPTENRLVRDSIMNAYSLGYNNTYNTSFFIFDKNNIPVNNDEYNSYAELNTIFSTQSKPTGVKDFYYYETSFEQFVYIIKREINDSTKFLGTLFILASPKQYRSTNALFPDLFSTFNENDIENSSSYSYAIYRNNKLWQNSSKYPFHVLLSPDEVPAQEYESRKNGDYDELWYKASNQKIIVIAKGKDSFIESITLFSYLFCAFLFMVGVIKFAGLILNISGKRSFPDTVARMSIRTQIHSTIIFISVLSFLIIGVATISFFIVRYNRNNIDRLSKTAGSTVKELNKLLKANEQLNNAYVLNDSASALPLLQLVHEVADIHNVIANIYDLNGALHVTSNEVIYKKGFLSTRMHPDAYFHLHTLKEVQRVQQETVNNLAYLSIYTAIRNNKGDTYAYLNIPSFSSQIELNEEISNFLVTIINLNAFIFLIAGVIALFITNRISRSFSVIGDKMKAISLAKTNEEIIWNKDDEIGELVNQYNRMVHQLEASATALAKSEREGAWREMARQVAHEIKNPLTPMKLSIQYLQKAIQQNKPNVKDLTTNVANTLIEQIEHLSKIAADFSQFANIGHNKLQPIDLHVVLRSLIDLFAANPNIQFSWQPVDGPLRMHADKTHMNRLFTNLLTNAVDACLAEKKCVISIVEQVENDHVSIAVTDNGEGIPAETQPKIFTPNFTTKSSGTGLGLAMCKSIVEQAGGEIWFETQKDAGTTFHVKLPLSH